MNTIKDEDLQSASPDSIFQAQSKPSEKAVKNLEQWRDQQAQDEWQREQLDAVIQYLRNEVAQ